MKSPVAQFWQQLSSSALLRFLLLFACGWAIVQLIDYFYTVISVFTAATILAVLLNYPIQWLTRFVPRPSAIALVFSVSLGLLLAAMITLGIEVVYQGQALIDRVTEYLETADSSEFTPFSSLVEENRDQLIQTVQTALSTILEVLQTVFSNFIFLIFVVVVSVYMVIDGDRIWAFCLKAFPVHIRDRVADVVQRSFIGFFRAQLMLMLFLSTSSLLVFSVLGIGYALVLAIIVGFLDAVPGIGATLGVFVITMLVFSSQGFWVALKVVIASVVLQQLQDNFVAPQVMKGSLNINPVLLFFAIFVGERIAGVLGIFLAIPIAAMIVGWFETEPPHAETDPFPEATNPRNIQD